MRLRVALLLSCLLLMLAESSARRCRKKKAGKKCESTALGPPRWRRRKWEPIAVERELGSVVLKCQVRSNPRPKYAWYRDGTLLNTKRNKKYRRKKFRLTISSLQMKDSGQYTCRVHNALGVVNRTFTLRVLKSEPVMSEISIKERPENQTAQIGDNVVFRCSTDTYPRPTIEWSRKAPGSPRVDILEKPSDKPSAEMFVLDSVTKADAGLYTCTIKNGMSTRQLTASLVVIGEGEKLPFEPKCALHVRNEILFDSVHGCQTREPVKITYCMGSCGRSYFVPTLVTSDNSSAITSGLSHVNQTCECCVGIVQGLRFVALECPSGGNINAFITTLRGCQCRSCQVEDEMSKARSGSTTRKP